MVHELASFQGATDKCQMTVERLYLALFRPQAALFGHVMELNNQLAGFALWYRSFSTWDSIFGIHLEDLYIRPQYRHQGLGRGLLAELAAECVRHGYSRLQWNALTSNSTAIRFYRDLAAEPLNNWTAFRLSGDALEKLGRESE